MKGEIFSMDHNTRDRISRYSIEELLDTLSLNVMRDNIQTQIENINSSDRDFMSIVKDKFGVIKEGDYDSDTMRKIIDEIDKFYNEVVNPIVSKFNLAYSSSEDLGEVAEVLYNFFVIERKSNTEKFIESYIDGNMESIIESLGLDKSNDVATISMARKSKDTKSILIAANINTVIDYILDLDISSEYFLDVLSAEGDYYVSAMVDYANAGEIDGHYPSLYMKEILSEYDSDYASEIRTSLRYNYGMKGK